MDQNHTYATFFKKRLPHVDIISDLFHMTANSLKDVMDKVRLRIAKKLRSEGNEEGYRMFKHAFLPYKLKQEVKDKLFRNSSEYLLPPIDHQKRG